MKKNIQSICFIFSVFIAAVFISGCAGVPAVSSFTKYPDDSVNYTVAVKSVSVLSGLVSEETIARQIQSMTETMLSAYVMDKSSEEQLDLQITVTQRAFFKYMEEYNSIYVSYILTDAAGCVVMEEGFYRDTRASILSSIEQYKLTERMTNRIKSFLQKSGKVRRHR